MSEDFAEKKTEPDNIDLCVRAAAELSEIKGKRIDYGYYMGLYHEEKYPFNKRKRTKK